MSTPVLTAEQRRDAELGMVWWNGLTKPARALWLDRAWKRKSPPGEYSLETMPSAADAWAAFRESGSQL